nr:EOG090X0FVI [Macrothrix elegans]
MSQIRLSRNVLRVESLSLFCVVRYGVVCHVGIELLSRSTNVDLRHQSNVLPYFKRLGQTYQTLLDKSTPHPLSRWIFTFVLITIFLARVLLSKGWYIVTYALGIYHLNLFIAFLSPKIDPALSEFDEPEDGPELPTKANEEFRPFIRRLPEFKFWYSVSKSTGIALICTFFEVFNIPVFWPILVMYFITLFCLTMKRQIKHMIKYRYIPFTHGKPKYQADNNKSLGAMPKK